MEVTNEELLQLIGQKEIELYKLRKYITELQSQFKELKEQQTGE